MNVRVISIPIAATNLFTLSGRSVQHVSGIIFQAPEANTGTIFFGDRSHQLFEIRPKANGTLQVADITSVWVKGTPGDKLILGLM